MKAYHSTPRVAVNFSNSNTPKAENLPDSPPVHSLSGVSTHTTIQQAITVGRVLLALGGVTAIVAMTFGGIMLAGTFFPGASWAVISTFGAAVPVSITIASISFVAASVLTTLFFLLGEKTKSDTTHLLRNNEPFTRIRSPIKEIPLKGRTSSSEEIEWISYYESSDSYDVSNSSEDEAPTLIKNQDAQQPIDVTSNPQAHQPPAGETTHLKEEEEDSSSSEEKEPTFNDPSDPTTLMPNNPSSPFNGLTLLSDDELEDEIPKPIDVTSNPQAHQPSATATTPLELEEAEEAEEKLLSQPPNLLEQIQQRSKTNRSSAIEQLEKERLEKQKNTMPAQNMAAILQNLTTIDEYKEQRLEFDAFEKSTWVEGVNAQMQSSLIIGDSVMFVERDEDEWAVEDDDENDTIPSNTNKLLQKPELSIVPSEYHPVISAAKRYLEFSEVSPPSLRLLQTADEVRLYNACFEAITSPSQDMIQSLAFGGSADNSTTYKSANQAIKDGNVLRQEFLEKLQSEDKDLWDTSLLATLSNGWHTVQTFEDWNKEHPDDPTNLHVTMSNYHQLKQKWAAFLQTQGKATPESLKPRYT